MYGSLPFPDQVNTIKLSLATTITIPYQTGTTWTQEMVWLLVNNLNFGKARQIPLIERSPFLE